MKGFTRTFAAVGIFAALLIFPGTAADAVRSGLEMCAGVIIPSLFPFFVATNLISSLGVSRLFANALSPFGAKVFGVSGHGAAAFIIGITGGYPLGASYIAGLRRSSLISSDEASRLLIFCSNSGPAFIIGAAGVGIFSSVAVGFFLYAVHILSALTLGIILSPRTYHGIIAMQKHSNTRDGQPAVTMSFSSAFTDAVKRSADAVISVCAFIITFSALCGILDELDILPALAGRLSVLTGTELSWCRALSYGILELGNGIGSMAGLDITPLNLALAAFILGWGGISVHFQTISMISGTHIKTARYVIGRFFAALIAAATALLGSAILF